MLVTYKVTCFIWSKVYNINNLTAYIKFLQEGEKNNQMSFSMLSLKSLMINSRQQLKNAISQGST